MRRIPRLMVAVTFLAALILHVALHTLFGSSHQVPRLVTLTVAAIALRWGSVTGGYLGALGGLILALQSGETPFAPTFALAVAGWLAGEIASYFAVESIRAVRLAMLAAVVSELLAFSLARGFSLPGGVGALVWTSGWAVTLGPLLHRLVVWYSTPLPGQRLPKEPE